MQLNEDQQSLLRNPQHLRALAAWTIRTGDNHVTESVRQAPHIARNNSPADSAIRQVTGYLKGLNGPNNGILVRLINGYRQAQTSA